jgi:hypothetical protein
MYELLVPVIILLLSFLILFLFGKRDEQKNKKKWKNFQKFLESDAFKEMRALVDSNMEAIDFAYGEANELKQLGSIEEARKLLDVGCKIITRFTPSLLKMISWMMDFSRMLVAITPFKPLSPGKFKVAQLASLAVLNTLIHQFVVSMKDRFKLKLYILGKGIAMAGSYLVKSTKNILTSRTEEEKDWERIDDLLNDYKELSRETLACLKVVHDADIIDAKAPR